MGGGASKERVTDLDGNVLETLPALPLYPGTGSFDEFYSYCVENHVYQYSDDPYDRHGRKVKDFCNQWSAGRKGLVGGVPEGTTWDTRNADSPGGINWIKRMLVESAFGIPGVEALWDKFFPEVSMCFGKVYDYYTGKTTSDPGTYCYMVVGFTSTIVLVLAMAALILITQVIGITTPFIGPLLAGLKDLGDGIFSMFRGAARLAYDLLLVLLRAADRFANYLAEITRSSPSVWKILFAVSAAWVGLQIVLKGNGFYADWKNSYFEDIYDWLSYPVTLFKECIASRFDSGILNWLASVFAAPFSMGIFAVSVFLGIVWYPFDLLIQQFRVRTATIEGNTSSNSE